MSNDVTKVEIGTPADSICSRRRWLSESLQRSSLMAMAIANGCGGLREAFGSVLHAQSQDVAEDNVPEDNFPDYLQGLILGSLFGDALGGPIEFADAERLEGRQLGIRDWPATRRVTRADFHQWGQSIRLESYATLRPDSAAYGPWAVSAEAGTVTDDSRHKIILLRALRKAASKESTRSLREHIAHEFLDFQPNVSVLPSTQLLKLVDEGLREYRYAARWELGERDLSIALPTERLWGGIDNCSGQMMFLPIAGLFPGQPENAYRATYALDWIDSNNARDMCSSLVAGLSALLSSDNAHPRDNAKLPARERWEVLWTTMRETDPYRFAEVPFAGRPLHRWLDLANEFVVRAEGSPKKLFELLESDGKPTYWWDAHFTLLVPIAMISFCELDSRAAIRLTIEFGHDTDSYLQVLCAMIGAVHGVLVFESDDLVQVTARLRIDYGEDVLEWLSTIRSLANRIQAGEFTIPLVP